MQFDLYQRWFNFLLFTNPSENNLKLSHRFFYNVFRDDPTQIVNFLRFLTRNMLSNKYCSKKKQLAFKYLLLISHLCERFNVSREGQYLDNLCFRVINPSDYHKINADLTKYKNCSKIYVKNIIKNLDAVLKNNNIDHYQLNGRYKNIYSLYKKLHKYPYRDGIFQLRDIFAFRIVLNNDSIKECYRVTSLLRNSFCEVKEFFKDYVMSPKKSGYKVYTLY